MLDRRLQVLIDADRWERLVEEANRRNVSVSTVVREAIDLRYPADAEGRKRALQAVLDAAPMPVVDPAELRREIDEIRSRRA